MGMSYQQVKRACDAMALAVYDFVNAGDYPADYVEPERMAPEAVLDTRTLCRHLAFMTQEIPAFMSAGRVEKAMRWLGWMQGAAVTRSIITLEAAKRHNMPPGTEYDATA